ncbi:MAG: CocE/NonD family hydrolase [Crocinitomicaceae bacterium]|nr:CocE/NonD family hydrolase [Crocinitomicaceae bacterium]
MKTKLSFLFILVSTLLLGQDLTTADYTKKEVYIEMRDGVKLFTTIYTPNRKKEKFPVLMYRTPYSVAPYGPDTMPARIMHNPELVASGYIFVQQDVRGRWMSEGEFENTKPPYSFTDPEKTDEVTDSYDTYDWLVKNLKNFNGNIGQYGNSYLGYTSLVASVTGHPNLKAVLAMAPVTNFFFEDFNRYGLYGMNYMPVMDVFGMQKTEPTTERWYNVVDRSFVHNAENWITEDYYDYFLKRRALSNTSEIISEDNFFWKNIIEHPNYDAYRQERDWIQYLDSTKCQTMIVGGWNDEQNLYGILNSFKKLIDNPASNVQLVMGPWSHGHPMRRDSAYYLGDIFYGVDFAENYQQLIEFKYFEYHLKGLGEGYHTPALVFDTGLKYWLSFKNDLFEQGLEDHTLFLHPNGQLSESATSASTSFVSDPDHPVPFIEGDDFYIMAPKHYMTDDQRFLGKRPDVLTYISEPLTENMTVRGEIQALIQFATDHEDADIYVKVIDVFPMDRTPEDSDKPDVKMNGFQHLVRCGYIRGRFRDDFSNPKPFDPDVKTEVKVPLLEVMHTFKKGHRIMIQVQSSMFPLFDLNPQNYVENIYQATNDDFQSATHTVFGDSKIILPVVSK